MQWRQGFWAGLAAFCLLILGTVSGGANAPQEKLEAIRAAYRALMSVSCEMTITTSADAPDTPPLKAKISVAFPSRAAIVVEEGDSSFRTVGGPAGQQIIPLKGQVTAETKEKPATLEDSFRAAHLSSSLLGQLLSNAPLNADDNVVTEDGVATEGGVSVRRLTWRRATESGIERIALTIGEKDSLLRQAIVTIGEGDTAFRRTEKYAAIQTNPILPEALFAVTKPIAATPAKSVGRPHIPDAQRAQAFDNGVFSPLDRPELIHDFPIKNLSDKPLTVRRLVTSCGCTSSVVAPAPPNADGTSFTPMEEGLAQIAPGAETTIRVRVRTAGLPAGALAKSVNVFADGSPAAIAKLEMQGKLLPAINLPATLSLGDIAAGQEATQQIAVAIDARLLTTEPPALLSSAPIITVTLIGKDAPTGDANNPSSAVTYRYKITRAKNAPLGPINETLHFAESKSENKDYAALWKAAVASIKGTARGDVAAEPSSLVFGTVMSGQETPLETVLTYKTPKRDTARRIVSGSPYLRVTANAVSGKTETLTITVLPNAPLGVLKAQTEVTLANGQRLIIPILAYVGGVSAFSPQAAEKGIGTP